MEVVIKVPAGFRDIVANTILELAKEHRELCDGNCSIALFPLRDIISSLLERPLTDDEFKVLS